jgi:hypothetical protein
MASDGGKACDYVRMNIRILAFAIIVIVIGVFGYKTWFPSESTTTPENTTETAANTTKTSTQGNTSTQSTGASQTTSAPVAAVESTRFCPKFASGAKLGTNDGPVASGMRGDVSNLQFFLMGEYGLASSFVNGSFNSETESYLKRWQKEEGISQTGVLDSESQRVMLSACVTGAKANGVEFARKNFTLTTGSVTNSVFVHEALVESLGDVEDGAFRIELVSKSGTAQLRVTGPVLGGLQSQRFSLSEGETRRTTHSPSISIKVNDITSSGAQLTISK